MQEKTIICGCVVTPFGLIENGMVVVEKDRIIAVGRRDDKKIQQAKSVYDERNHYIIPGFIDIHCHGGLAGMFYEDHIDKFTSHHLQHGTTSILPTFVYNQSHLEIMNALPEVLNAMEQRFSTVLGIHMEGPYINPKYGAITAPIRPVNPKEYEEILQLAGEQIKLWTLSPELNGQTEFMQKACEYGIVFSVGHSEATPDTIFEGHRLGLRVGCHLTNASSSTPNNSRFDGTLELGVHEAVLLHDDMYAEVIPDRGGIHVRPLMLRLIVKTKGVNRVIIITDATGYVDEANGPDVCILQGNEHTPGGEEKEILAGSLLTMDSAVRNMMEHTGVGIVDACKMASLNPARLLGVDRDLGSIEVGKKANLLIIKDKVDVQWVMLEGQIKHKIE
ncbi:N-acetylglucosamine 6-phosphate deacetylase [Virgibacillus subterraneus]|uniref:N-acetylglucosamine 6-phosphate deacetylase n=1 Tax=Virgibacillus subterraneus TaxID=621109 RepID=A0A1H9G6W8_9BACI|nr:N-acetylglucosamine-6-phosphate deacetylase [Virgibacillus subterraneus]SEQ45812.1 N-acetylglucosamine 6-phosphate deacetylase [Virgibacillus subterraneus]